MSETVSRKRWQITLRTLIVLMAAFPPLVAAASGVFGDFVAAIVWVIVLGFFWLVGFATAVLVVVIVPTMGVSALGLWLARRVIEREQSLDADP